MSAARRRFLGLLGTGALALPVLGRAGGNPSKPGRRVVVVGGGFGGTIAARFIRRLDPSIEVVLIERNRQHVCCPFSNHVIGGLRRIQDITFGYDALAGRHGVRVLFDEMVGVDPAAREVATRQGERLRYDRLVLSPGIDFRFEEIEGYDPATTPAALPHAWQAGPQTVLLRQQLEAMPDGGRVLVSMPLAPYRCPGGPYERVCLIAAYLKERKPRSKVLLLDANPDIVVLGAHFRRAWESRYGGMIEYLPGMKVTKVAPQSRTLYVEGVEPLSGDVVSLIPPQRAGTVATRAGLVGPDWRWCPVDARSFESTIHAGIHVIGDAAMAGAMPKSGHSANSQAKACAMNVVALLNGGAPAELPESNVCYSAISREEAVSVAAAFRVADGELAAVPGSVGTSPQDFSAARREHLYAESWLRNILAEMSA